MAEFGSGGAEHASASSTENDDENQRLGDEGHTERERGVRTACEEQSDDDQHTGDGLHDGQKDQETRAAKRRESSRVSRPVRPAEHRDATIPDPTTVVFFNGPLREFRVEDASHAFDLSGADACQSEHQAGRR